MKINVNNNLKKFSPKFFVKTSYLTFWNALTVFRKISPITVNGIEIANILNMGERSVLWKNCIEIMSDRIKSIKPNDKLRGNNIFNEEVIIPLILASSSLPL